MTKQTPAWERSSCTAQVWDYLQAECFVRPLPKGHEASAAFCSALSSPKEGGTEDASLARVLADLCPTL